MNRAPEVIIIGAMKCATSTLHDQLAAQDGIFMTDPKEPCFFSNDERWDRGPAWYTSLFESAAPGDICGESSTHYTKLPTYPRTVERMHSMLGRSAKFIYIMRHPLDRLVSQYVHEWTQRVIDAPIDEALDQHPELIDYSRYAMQIEPFLETFGPESVLPVFFERLSDQPQVVLEEVCAFVGLTARPRWREDLHARNISSERLRKSALRDAIVELPVLATLRRRLVPRALRDRIKRFWTMKERPRLSMASTDRLQKTFDDDLSRLGQWLGLDLHCGNFAEVARASKRALGHAHERAGGMSRTARQSVGVVAIGRNEGERLACCLDSVCNAAAAVVYVDSGSTDNSVDLACDRGVEVVSLDIDVPFTAARARNAGIARLVELNHHVEYVQVVDGDCEVVDDWIESAAHALDKDARAAVVCGRRRERHPEASDYNRLCDIEWNTPVGETSSCGGDAMIRLAALQEVSGFDDSLIAGEEPELCFRLRQHGWTIHRIDRDMTMHDADMTRISQWWRRMVRSGHAYAEGRAMHGRSPERFRVHEVRSIVEWACLLPLVALSLAWFTWGASLLLLLAYVLLWFRIRRRQIDAGAPRDHASLFAWSCVVGKMPQMIGVLKFHLNRLLGRRSTLIEYKSASAVAPHAGNA